MKNGDLSDHVVNTRSKIQANKTSRVIIFGLILLVWRLQRDHILERWLQCLCVSPQGGLEKPPFTMSVGPQDDHCSLTSTHVISKVNFSLIMDKAPLRPDLGFSLHVALCCCDQISTKYTELVSISAEDNPATTWKWRIKVKRKLNICCCKSSVKFCHSRYIIQIYHTANGQKVSPKIFYHFF